MANLGIDSHGEILNTLCRVCGECLAKSKDKYTNSYTCASYAGLLYDAFGIDVNHDEPGRYPPEFCSKCYKKASRDTGLNVDVKEWPSHRRTGDCLVCTDYVNKRIAGRPRKPKRKTSNPHTTVTPPHTTITPPHTTVTPPHPTVTPPRTTVTPPHTTVTPPHTTVTPPHTTVTPPHTTVTPPHTTVTPPHTMSPMTVLELLQTPKGTIPSALQEVGILFVRRALAQSSDGQTVLLKTGGQPLELVRRPRPRKATSNASVRTVRARSELLEATRNAVSAGASTNQIAHEMTRRKKLLKECFGEDSSQPIQIPEGDFLAMKADLGDTWYQLRKVKRWLSHWGIRTDNEAQQRKQVAALVDSDNLECEDVPLEFRKPGSPTVVKPAPMAYIRDLRKFILHHLDENERAGRLTWENNAIPPDEVHIKIGGDSGGGSFKMAFQIANLAHPNSKTNTVVFLMFEAKDSWTNLETSLRPYHQQLDQLETTLWRGKKIVLFFFGDYELLCKALGHAGASGTYPCLWCLANQKDMQQPRALRPDVTLRTRESMKDDLERYRADGSRHGRQRLFNNIVHETLIDIELDKVCIPGLHISLGLFKKFFENFEDACHLIDKEIYLIGTNEQEHTTPEFRQQMQALKDAQEHQSKAKELLEKADSVQDLLNLNLVHGNHLLLASGVADLQKQLGELRTKAAQEKELANERLCELPKADGPLVKEIDHKLQQLNVKRQAYHGKSFIGNHVHICLKPQNIKIFTNCIVEKTRELCPLLLTEATNVAGKFGTLFNLFGKCHNLYNTAGQFSDEEINNLDSDIKALLTYIHITFPDMSIPPKLHMLEDHVCPFLRKHKMGLGFYGEQGIEGIHSDFNTKAAKFAQVKRPTDRLKQLMIDHHLSTSPSLAGRVPRIKRRKLVDDK